MLDHIAFDEVTYEGTPAVYDHSPAFAAWGDITVELTQVHAADPPALERPPGIGHVAWLAKDLDAETARLEAAGLRAYHEGRIGPVLARWFTGGPFGHPVEVLLEVPELLAFHASVRAGGSAAPAGAAEAARKKTGHV